MAKKNVSRWKMNGREKGKRRNIIMRPQIDEMARMMAAKEGCSVSWIISEAILYYAGVSAEEFEQMDGKQYPKKITERRENPGWKFIGMTDSVKAKRDKIELDKRVRVKRGNGDEADTYYLSCDTCGKEKEVSIDIVLELEEDIETECSICGAERTNSN